MNSDFFLKVEAKPPNASQMISLFIPMSSISYLERLDPERYFIFFKDGVIVRGVDSGSMINIDIVNRKQLGLPI
jgi:hypothetical protein